MFRKMMGRMLREIAFAPPVARGAQWAAGSLLNVRDIRKYKRHEAIGIIRSLAGGQYIGNATAVCRVLGHQKMLVDTNDVGIGIHLMMEGFWEMWLTEVMLDLVKPGMCAIDIGANLGYYALLMAELVGADGSVHAFEPNPAMVGLMERTLLLNGHGHATAHQMALGDAGGEVRLIVPAGIPGGAYIEDGSGAGVVVPCRRFDEIAEVQAADFIKIDVEGSEEKIWRGMRGTFAQQRSMTIALEFVPARYPDPAAFLDAIQREGFSFELIDLLDGIVPITPAALLAGPPVEERLLVLRR